jgi:hypothetical protein
VSDQSVAAATPDDLVAALARATVERAAPEELPLFGPMSEAYLADPSALEDGGKKRDEVLGFGVDAAVVLITPVALQVARDVLGFLHEQLRERAREQGEGAIDRIIAKLVGKKGEAAADEPVPELTDAQLEQVRKFAVEKARSLKLSEERAGLLADSLVGSLATA